MGCINVCVNAVFTSDSIPMKVLKVWSDHAHKSVAVCSSTFHQHVVSRDARLYGVGAVPHSKAGRAFSDWKKTKSCSTFGAQGTSIVIFVHFGLEKKQNVDILQMDSSWETRSLLLYIKK